MISVDLVVITMGMGKERGGGEYINGVNAERKGKQ